MQLKMWRPAEVPIPESPLAEGFVIRPMREGEQVDWAYCCLGEFGVNEVSAKQFELRYKDFPIDHVFFACKGDKPVGTASARVTEDNEPFLHYIAVNPEYRGYKLAKPLMERVLRCHIAEGRGGCFLTTDDERIPAVKSYLTYGYYPVLWSDDARERWEKALAEVGIERIAAYMPDLTRAEDIIAAK